jgi:hypothetical protein
VQAGYFAAKGADQRFAQTNNTPLRVEPVPQPGERRARVNIVGYSENE